MVQVAIDARKWRRGLLPQSLHMDSLTYLDENIDVPVKVVNYERH